MLRSGGIGVSPNPVHGLPALTRLAWCTGTPNPGVYTDVSNTCLSNGVDTWCIRQTRHVCVAPGPLQLVLAWAGGYEDNSIKPGLPANTGTVSVTAWKQAANPNTGGTGIDVLFGGATSVTINPAELVISDNGPTLAVGDIVWLRTLTTVPAGGKWPLGVKTVTQSDGTDGGTQGTGTPPDLLHGGTVFPTTNANQFGACSSIAVGATGLPAVGMLGTSIAEGSNASWHEAHVVQACNAAGIPVVRLGAGGESANALSSVARHRMRYALAAQATVIYCEHGVNDFRAYAPSDWVSMATLLRSLHSQLNGIDGGRPVIQLTLPPSYASDPSKPAWTNTANEIPSSANAVRAGFNDWVRAGMPEKAGAPVAAGTAGATASLYAAGYDEISDPVETARNSGVWKADGTSAGRYTFDGTHPSQVATVAMVPNINTDRVWTLSGLTKPTGPAPPPPPPPPPEAATIMDLQRLGSSLVRL